MQSIAELKYLENVESFRVHLTLLHGFFQHLIFCYTTIAYLQFFAHGVRSTVEYCNVFVGKIAHRLHMAKVSNYVLAKRDSEPYYVAVHIPGSKVIHRLFCCVTATLT